MDVQDVDDEQVQQSTCRTCSAQKEDDVYTPLFAGPTSCQLQHKDALWELTAFNLKISQDDGLPQQICSRCLDNFKFIVQFREQCKDAQEVLEAIYERNEKCEIDVKTRIEVYRDDDDDDEVKSEPQPIKVEEVLVNSNGIEEVNLDAQNYDDEDNWDREYLIDSKYEDLANNSTNDDAELRMSGTEIDLVMETENNSEDSDNIPLNEYRKISVTKKLIKSNPGRKKKQGLSQSENGKNKISYPCKYCGKPCKTLTILSRHKRTCPDRTDVACEICTVEFESKELLAKHIAELHPNGSDPMCPICSQTFPDANKRDTHIRARHGNAGDYQCEICDKMFKTKVYLKSHITRYHQSAENECSICHEKFTNVSKYRYHWTHAHIENMKFKCKYCEKPFATQFVMRVHERSHTGERPFLCNQCGVAFRYRTQFLDHMKTHESQRDIACDMCGLTFYTNRQLSNHKRKHMSKNHPCEICGEAFAYKLDLYSHKYNEHKIAEYNPKRKVDYPFTCPKCSKGFSVLTSLTKHIKIHTDTERKHACPHCGNTYKRSDHLKLHIKRMHLKITEHKCEVCGREYLEKCALRAHMVVHDSARPFTCTKCPASFKRQRSLRDHLLKHEGKKEYACGICDMRFYNRTIVVLHTKRVHSDSQKQFMSELVRKELEEATSKLPENESSEELKDELINV